MTGAAPAPGSSRLLQRRGPGAAARGSLLVEGGRGEAAGKAHGAGGSPSKGRGSRHEDECAGCCWLGVPRGRGVGAPAGCGAAPGSLDMVPGDFRAFLGRATELVELQGALKVGRWPLQGIVFGLPAAALRGSPRRGCFVGSARWYLMRARHCSLGEISHLSCKE